MAEPCRIVVMASGSGSNFQALVSAVSANQIADSKIVRLFVNRKTAFAATRAEKAGIPSTYFNMVSGGFQPKGGEKDPEKLKEARGRYDAVLADKVLEEKPDLIVLAGWMHIFTPSFLRPLDAQGVPIINLHPALPGAYDGSQAIERAFADFKAGKLEHNRTGIMIHHIIEEVDRGEVIMKREIECKEGDDLAALEERIHSNEHELIVAATAQMAREIVAKKSRTTA